MRHYRPRGRSIMLLSFILFLALGGAQPAADTTPAATTEPPAAITETPPAETPLAEVASAEPSRERLICRSRPTLGSRITRTRVCKTADEWRIYEADMEQSRRDINDRGMRGCTATSCE